MSENKVKTHVCKYCARIFTKKSSWVEHERIHAGVKSFECQYCGKSFTKKSNRTDHERIHTGVKPYTCKYCGKNFTTSSSCTAHEKIHFSDRPYNCQHCGRGFSQLRHWSEHESRHSASKPHTCRYCDKGFTKVGDRNRHEKIHTGEKPYKCQYCGKGFSQRGDCNVHERLHTGVKPYQCRHCPKKFLTSSNRLSHERSQHQNSSSTPSTSNERDDNLHLNYESTPDDVMPSDVIHSLNKSPSDRQFASESSFNEHTTSDSHKPNSPDDKFDFTKHEPVSDNETVYNSEHSRHSSSMPSNPDHTSLVNEDTFMKEEKIGKGLSQLRHWFEHESMHSANKPHTCRYCAKGFKKVGDRNRHEKIHTGEKPYKCRYCDKGFSQSGDCNVHERRHTGVKPYQCRHCSKKFLTSSNRLAHERSQHQDSLSTSSTSDQRGNNLYLNYESTPDDVVLNGAMQSLNKSPSDRQFASESSFNERTSSESHQQNSPDDKTHFVFIKHEAVSDNETDYISEHSHHSLSMINSPDDISLVNEDTFMKEEPIDLTMTSHSSGVKLTNDSSISSIKQEPDIDFMKQEAVSDEEACT